MEALKRLGDHDLLVVRRVAMKLAHDRLQKPEVAAVWHELGLLADAEVDARGEEVKELRRMFYETDGAAGEFLGE